MPPADPAAGGAVLRAVGVTRVFATPAEQVFGVRDVDLEVRSGEFVCLMGPSGCGKSTLIGLLAGLDVPTSGSIELDGASLSTRTPEARANLRLRQIGLVFQDHRLIPEFTAIENAMLPLELSGVSPDAARDAAAAALDRVGLVGLHARFPDELSGGQRQRVGIARAIVGERRAILADEATGALDHGNSVAVFTLLRALADSGYAVLAATHDRTGSEWATRTVHMVDGRLTREAVLT